MGVNDAAEAVNKAEHEAVHLLAHVHDAIEISGRTSALNVPAGFDCVVNGELIHDSDFTCRKLIYGSLSRVTCDPTKSFTVKAETIIQSHGGSFEIICENPKVTQRWMSLPRTCNCEHEECTESPCRSHDQGDLGGGFIYMGNTTVKGASKTPYARPSKLTSTSGVFRHEGWRTGDTLCFPAVKPGEKDEEVTITVGGSSVETITEVIDQSKPWVFPDGITSATFKVVNGQIQASYTRPVAGDPSQITFNPPLQFPHIRKNGKYPYVANLTRNIIFESAEYDEVWKRGHIMGMHSPASTWSYYEVRNMGRTRADIPITKIKFNADGTVASANYGNPVGRYAEHIGHWRTGGNEEPTDRVGAVYRWFLKLAGVNHGGHVRCYRCIAVNGDGSGFMGENGLERGGLYECLAIGVRLKDHKLEDIRTQSRSAIGDFGWEGYGIWLQGGGMEVVGGAVYNCNQGVGGYARPLSEISSRCFDPNHLREGTLKDWALTTNKGKLIDNASVPFRINAVEIENCERDVGLSYQENGNEHSAISDCDLHSNARCLDTNYMKAGVDLINNEMDAPYPTFYNTNVGSHFKMIGNKINGGIWGLEDVSNGAVEIKDNVFSGSGSPDIRLRAPSPASTVPHTINGVLYGPAATAAVRASNTRADGRPLVVEGP